MVHHPIHPKKTACACAFERRDCGSGSQQALRRRHQGCEGARRYTPLDLSKLTWRNPDILSPAHERMSLFIFLKRDEIISGLNSRIAAERRRAIDRMGANPALFGDLGHSAAFALLTPARRRRRSNHSVAAVYNADEVRLAREVAAEQAIEREREAAIERERERVLADAVAQEPAEVMVERRPLAPAPPASLWPSHIRRPTRGRRW